LESAVDAEESAIHEGIRPRATHSIASAEEQRVIA
jgi:hypothetical protein